MTTRILVSTAEEYALALVPHLEHEGYRADDPSARMMGKGCLACRVEILISIEDFRGSGDLEVFDRQMKPHAKKAKK